MAKGGAKTALLGCLWYSGSIPGRPRVAKRVQAHRIISWMPMLIIKSTPWILEYEDPRYPSFIVSCIFPKCVRDALVGASGTIKVSPRNFSARCWSIRGPECCDKCFSFEDVLIYPAVVERTNATPPPLVEVAWSFMRWLKSLLSLHQSTLFGGKHFGSPTCFLEMVLGIGNLSQLLSACGDSCGVQWFVEGVCETPGVVFASFN